MSPTPLPMGFQWGVHPKEIRGHLCPGRQADLKLLPGGALGRSGRLTPTLSTQPHLHFYQFTRPRTHHHGSCMFSRGSTGNGESRNH